MSRFDFGYIKYKNKKTMLDGIIFSSAREAKEYSVLRLRERAKEIKDLILQPKYTLQDKFADDMGVNHRAITYIADFQFYDVTDGKIHVVDAKGMKTEVYKIKKKLFLHKMKGSNIVFEEV